MTDPKQPDPDVVHAIADRMAAESADPLLRDQDQPIGDDLGSLFDLLNDIRDRAIERASAMPEAGNA